LYLAVATLLIEIAMDGWQLGLLSVDSPKVADEAIIVRLFAI
jgi:hypothetical protein